MQAELVLDQLIDQKPIPLNKLPADKVGIYALADHLGQLRYVGITDKDGGFRSRIYSYHTTGSEEVSHKFSCNYNIGRMFRNRRAAYHVDECAKVSKDLRTAFIRRYCAASFVALQLPLHHLRAIESEIVGRLAPKDMVSWNNSRGRVNLTPEDRRMTDEVISELGWGPREIELLERQNALFEEHGDELLDTGALLASTTLALKAL